MHSDESATARAARDLFERAYDLQQRGELAHAIRLYKESLAHFPTAEAHTYLGWSYAGLHLFDDAIDQCRQAIALDPNFGNPYNDIGAYCIELGRWQEAIRWFDKAIAAPRYENREFAHFNAGRVYEHLGQWRRAIDSYQQAAAINLKYLPARWAARLLIGKLN